MIPGEDNGSRSNMTRRFEHKVAIVTGGASGIGRASAERLAAEGCAVAVADVNGEGAAKVAAAIAETGGKAFGIEADVSSSQSVKRLVTATAARFGRIDVLFANAGIGSSSRLVETTDEEWQRVHDVNEKGVFFSCREVVRFMLGQESPEAPSSSTHPSRGSRGSRARRRTRLPRGPWSR
jgi:NAD(P)-dependent dehydrogenase (short-subunit alcohol dehydrogenase family)